MPRITFQVSYDFFLGLLRLPQGTRIIDVQRGVIPGQFTVEAEAPNAEGKVEPLYDIVTMQQPFFKEWMKK